MQGDPMDMSGEMDEIFVRLFFRMDREFMDGTLREYGVRITLRDNGEGPKIPEMADDAASRSRVPGEPVAEVNRTANEIKVIAALPGMTEESLRLDVRGNTLVIDAGDTDHHYRMSAVLPR